MVTWLHRLKKVGWLNLVGECFAASPNRWDKYPSTLPETHSKFAPEKRPGPKKEMLIFQLSFFRGELLVSAKVHEMLKCFQHKYSKLENLKILMFQLHGDDA